MNRTAALTAAVVAAVLGTASAGGASPGGALFVDDDLQQCRNADFVSIQQAVAAAEPGETIRVCPGTYRENVVVPKTLSLFGAGPDPQQRDGDATREAVITPLVAGPGLDLRANEIFVEGFTIRGRTATGIRTSATFSGYRIQNNLLLELRFGLLLSSAGAEKSVVRENLFEDCTAAVQGSASNARIVVNDFTRNSAAVAFTDGDDVEIEENRFVLAVNGINVAVGTDTAIRNNAFDRVNNAIRLLAPRRAAITGNRIGFGLGDGIRADVARDSAFSFNHVTDRQGGSGILLVASRANAVVANMGRRNTLDGLRLGPGSSGNLIRNNRMEDNDVFDCRDDSGGVANTWEHNLGDVNLPQQICKPTPARP